MAKRDVVDLDKCLSDGDCVADPPGNVEIRDGRVVTILGEGPGEDLQRLPLPPSWAARHERRG